MKSRISWMVPWMESMAWSMRSPPEGRVDGHQLLGVLQRQADRVERLDGAVVEVLGDALALLQHRQLSQLFVHARVVDGQSRMTRERLDEPLVVLGEAVAAGLVGEVEVADGTALDR